MKYWNSITIQKSKESISKKKIDEKVALTLEMVQESIDNMKGACMIVYPMVIFVYINKSLFSSRDYHHTIRFKPNLKIAKISAGNKHQRYLWHIFFRLSNSIFSWWYPNFNVPSGGHQRNFKMEKYYRITLVVMIVQKLLPKFRKLVNLRPLGRKHIF